MIGPPGPAYGDTISGTNLAGGITAALLKRERTGEPSIVDVSLLGSGLWSMGHTVALTVHLGQRLEAPPPGVHGSPINPLVGLYTTSDGRYISFVMMQPDKFWADVCRHIDRPELAFHRLHDALAIGQLCQVGSNREHRAAAGADAVGSGRQAAFESMIAFLRGARGDGHA